MNCPYDDLGCVKVDTSGMDKPECKDCEHFKVSVTHKISLWQWFLNQISWTRQP